jgi:hypothetical protein
MDLQTALTTALVLEHYSLEREAMLETDVLDGVISGILSQK